MFESSENKKTLRETILEGIQRVTDLSVPSFILDKLFMILSGGTFPPGFSESALVHDPAVVAMLMKSLYERPEYDRYVFTEAGDLLKAEGPMEMYVLLSGLTPAGDFQSAEASDWKHAYSSFLLMRDLVTENDFPNFRYLPLLMLFHDIGKVALKQIAEKPFEETVARSRREHQACWMTERNILEIDHAEVGAELLLQWGFPEQLVQCIRYHHTSQGIPEENLLETAFVQFADWADSTVRGIPEEPLYVINMAAAGIEDIDTEYWLGRQKENVRLTDEIFENMIVSDESDSEDMDKTTGRNSL